MGWSTTNLHLPLEMESRIVHDDEANAYAETAAEPIRTGRDRLAHSSDDYAAKDCIMERLQQGAHDFVTHTSDKGCNDYTTQSYNVWKTVHALNASDGYTSEHSIGTMPAQSLWRGARIRYISFYRSRTIRCTGIPARLGI